MAEMQTVFPVYLPKRMDADDTEEEYDTGVARKPGSNYNANQARLAGIGGRMAVRIGHAVSDERGGKTGGIPGDQTGKEIRIDTWYARKDGWDYYLECKDAQMAERAARYMERICAGNFGYSQEQKARWSGYRAIAAVCGFVEGACGDFDCSSLAIACYILAGLKHPASGYTGSMRASLQKTGMFAAYTDPPRLVTSDYARRGSLYLKEGAHVLMCLEDGVKWHIAGYQGRPGHITPKSQYTKIINQ